MLHSVRLDDWKSFGSGEHARNVVPLGSVTLLVGPNASGKSNVLDALRFLQGLALDLPLGDVLRGRYEGQRETWPAIRGQVVEAARHGTSSFALTTNWEVLGQEAEHQIRVSTLGDVTVEQEHLSSPEGYWLDTHAPPLRTSAGRTGGEIRAAHKRASGKGGSPIEPYSALRSLLGQIPRDERFHSNVQALATAIRTSLREAVFLDIRPSSMRDYRPQSVRQLGTAGENISPILQGINKKTLSDVVDWVNELCAPSIAAIDFDVTQLREVMMYFVEKNGSKISARSISDGTLRFLGELVALLSCPEGSLMVLEEPDVGLHPARIHLLAELLEQIAARRKIQILATTHSPTLLAHVSDEVLADVIAFGRDSNSGCTVCSRLGDLEHFEKLRDARNLDHLVSTGWLERAL